MDLFKSVFQFVVDCIERFVSSGFFFPISMFLLFSCVIIILIIIFKEL